MGKRKSRIGRIKKNEERKRQVAGKYSVGRPLKRGQSSPFPAVNVPTPVCDGIDDLRSSCSLPPHWVDQSTGNTATLCKIAHDTPEHAPQLAQSIVVDSNLSWKVYIYGVELPVQCSLLRSFPSKLTKLSLQALVTSVDQSNACAGHPDRHFVSMLEARKGEVKGVDGAQSAYLDKRTSVTLNGDVYHETVRSSSCELITKGQKCQSCVKYRSTLRSLYGRWKKTSSPSESRSAVSSHTNYRYLTTPEKKMRLANLRSENKALHRQVDQLKQHISRLTDTNGIIVEEDMDADLRRIMDDNDEIICSTNSPQSFEYVFWKQQREAMSKSDARQMRWHPMMIKWCLHLHMLSSASYNSLRSTGVIKLPSERTLRDYSNVVKARSGLQADVDAQLVEEAKLAEIPEYQKYVALVFDEVKVKEDLVYNKHSGEVIGFVDITDINMHLKAFERSCDKVTVPQELASHMSVFMVRGLFSSLSFPYAQFPCATASADVLHPIVWHCIEHLEMIGLKVLALVCDGASPNRKFYKMHTDGTTQLTYKVKNIYADQDRPIFFVSDVPHLLKTTRNCWANSHAHSKSRKLWVRCVLY